MKKLLIGSVMALTVLGTTVVSAQEGEMPPLPEGATVVAQGLNYPRQLAVTGDGIYVAEVGIGDPNVPFDPNAAPVDPTSGVIPPMGPTSQVSWIGADGTVTPVLTNWPSIAGEGGATSVAATDDALWVVVNGFGPAGVPFGLWGGVYRFERATNHMTDYIDMYAYEAANNPDGNDIDSNPTDILVASDGTIYIVDTGANAVLTWTEEGGLATWVTWPENPVPTAIAEGPDGNLWVSFLGTEIAPGAGMVQQISPDGEILDTWSGYNALTDLAVAEDGSVYVVSLFSGFGDQGPLPGQVLLANAEGGEVIADGLMVPYGIGIGTDGNLLVSTGSTFVPPGTGMILSIPTGM